MYLYFPDTPHTNHIFTLRGVRIILSPSARQYEITVRGLVYRHFDRFTAADNKAARLRNYFFDAVYYKWTANDLSPLATFIQSQVLTCNV